MSLGHSIACSNAQPVGAGCFHLPDLVLIYAQQEGFSLQSTVVELGMFAVFVTVRNLNLNIVS